MTARRVLAATALSLVVLVAAAGACGDDDTGDGTEVTTETTAAGEKAEGTAAGLKSRLTGAEEVPGPGAEPGVGAFVFNVVLTQGCYELNVTMGEKPIKAHIHQGAKGASGPVVVDLMPAFESGEAALKAKSCVALPADVASKLLAEPGSYYVNVHSEAHPDGAIRGQLEKS
jgi:hypothetical protein